LAIAALVVALAGCDDLFGSDPVEVRIENASSAMFSEATLYTSEGPVTFGDVGPGEATPYTQVTTAYRFATTQVVVQGDTLRLQVIDFVGEEPLDGGRYTYVLGVDGLGTTSPSLTQTFRKDD
jgi:hypothetical protein